MYKCKHFKLQELVSPIVYKKYGEFAWSFFSEAILKDLDHITDSWKALHGSGIIINDWLWNGQYKESGIRSNVDSIVAKKTSPYMSGHVLAIAFDMKPQNKKYKEFFDFVWDMMESGELEVLNRLEAFEHTPTWIHADGFRTSNGKPKIFNI